MTYIIMPAVIGLFIKLSVLYLVGLSKKSKAFLFFVMWLAMHNLAELLLFYHYFMETDATLSMKIYYVCSVGVLVGMCVYAIEVSGFVYYEKMIKPIVFVSGLFAVLIVVTPLVIQGSIPISYSVTAIKGDWYLIFQATIIFTMFFSLFVLFKGVFSGQEEKKLRCSYALIALMPLIVIVIVVLVLMFLNFEVNAMGVVPIGTTLVILITLQGELKYNMTSMRMFLPFCKERRVALDLLHIISRYSTSGNLHKETMHEIEKLLFEYAYEQSSYCKTKTAKHLGISRSTLYGMLERFQMK